MSDKMMNKLMDANMAYVLVKANPRKYYKINKKFRTPEITLFYIEYCDKWCKKITFNNIPKHGYSFAVFIKILETASDTSIYSDRQWDVIYWRLRPSSKI